MSTQPNASFNAPPHRPRWLSGRDYQRLLDRDGPFYRCVTCVAARRAFDLGDLTIDHIVPRHHGGTNVLSNLQLLCRICNSAKGANPDRYWSDEFYWDLRPNLAAMRHANRDLYALITERYPGWFSRSRTDIAGVLHTLGWIVAAGKTLAIPTIAWAINRATLEHTHGRGVPRIDRVLVLTKEAGLRDQIADDLKHDVERYGIAPRAPRVAVVRQWDDLAAIRGEQGAELYVSTLQMFFRDHTNEPKFEFDERLGRFSLIVFDEPHWALDQVRYVLDRASAAISFGTTGSPIDAAGALLPSMVLVSSYGYDEAVQHDQSLKLLTEDLDAHLQTATIQAADLLDLPTISTTSESPDYARNLRPALSVILDVVRHLRACDQAMEQRVFGAAPHRPRGVDGAVADLRYPVHAVIKVYDRESGQYICNWLRNWLENRRGDFPAEDGYRVDFVVTEDPEQPELRPANPLRPDHPYFATWRKFRKCLDGEDDWDGRAASNAVRILLVLGMGREGSNNPMCGATVLAHEISSLVTGVQLFLGRELRGVQYRDEDDVLHVPPAIADTVHLFNHEAFPRNRRVLQDAVSFLLHMPERMEALPNLDDLVADLEPVGPTVDPSAPALEVQPDVADGMPPDLLDFWQRVRLAEDILRMPDPNQAISDMFPLPEQEPQREAAREWIEEVTEEPQRAVRRLHLDVQLRPVEIVLREYSANSATDSELREYLRWNNPELYAETTEVIDQRLRPWAEALYRNWRERFQPGPLPSVTTIEQIRRDMVTRIVAGNPDLGEATAVRQRVHQLVASAVQRVLGTTERVGRDTRFERPEVHQRLLRHDVQSNIRGWVIARLARIGLMPDLQRSLGQFIPPDERAGLEADPWWLPGAESNAEEE